MGAIRVLGGWSVPESGPNRPQIARGAYPGAFVHPVGKARVFFAGKVNLSIIRFRFQNVSYVYPVHPPIVPTLNYLVHRLSVYYNKGCYRQVVSYS